MSNQKKRIIIADNKDEFFQKLLLEEKSSQYEIRFIDDGEVLIDQIQTFKPDLLFLELFLHKTHGIAIIKQLKPLIQENKLGVVMMSYEILLQNYRASIEFGACSFLERPFDTAEFFSISEKFFNKTLKPTPFKGYVLDDYGADSYYNPDYLDPVNYLKFWGTRGSTPVSGVGYHVYGGNTSCLEITYGRDSVIIDSGTGIRPLGEQLYTNAYEKVNLLVSHTHQDHIQGFPFFLPLYTDKTEVNLWSPIGFEQSTQELFTQMLAYAFFPVRLEQMQASVHFYDLHDSMTLSFGQIKIDTCYVYHPGPTLGFKITTPHQTIGYITDNEFLVGYHGHPDEMHYDHPLMEYYRPLVNFLSDCDMLIHEAQYLPKEYQHCIGWGHSSMTNATALVKMLPKVKTWVVTHHDPRHRDRDIRLKSQLHKQVLHSCDMDIHLAYAYDEMVIALQ